MLLLGGPALARSPRLRLQYVDASHCRAGTIEVRLAELELEGVLRSRPASHYKLLLDGKPLAERATSAHRFAEASKPIALGLVIENSPAYDKALERVVSGARRLLRAVPSKSHVAVIAYSAEVRRLVSGSPRKAMSALDRLRLATDGVNPQLVAAVSAAMRSVTARGADRERWVVVVSDGVDRQPDWDVFRALGARARRQGVRIFAVGYSAIDERGPLLNLGELAKRSFGTMRWAQRESAIAGELENLARELSQRLVLSFRTSWRCPRPARLAVVGGALRSNSLELPAQRAEQDEDGDDGSHTALVAAGIGGVVVVAAGLALLARLLVRGRGRS